VGPRIILGRSHGANVCVCLCVCVCVCVRARVWALGRIMVASWCILVQFDAVQAKGHDKYVHFLEQLSSWLK